MMAVFKKDEVMDEWMHCDYHLASRLVTKAKVSE
jgi:hypothetical protein